MPFLLILSSILIDPEEGAGHFSFHSGHGAGHFSIHSGGGAGHFDVTLEVVQDTMMY